MTKAQFKTAHDQREIIVNVKVPVALQVGQVVTIGSTGLVDANKTTPATSDYIVAQSDMTMNRRNYSVSEYTYDDKVSASTVAKNVAVFAVTDVNDVKYETV